MKTQIEKDDEKMDELLMFQSMTCEDAKYSSIEEKYEEEIMIENIMEKVNKSHFDDLS